MTDTKQIKGWRCYFDWERIEKEFSAPVATATVKVAALPTDEPEAASPDPDLTRGGTRSNLRAFFKPGSPV